MHTFIALKCVLFHLFRAQKRKGENGIGSSNLTETRNKSNVENKFVDMAMEYMYGKFIAFARFHLYFAIL